MPQCEHCVFATALVGVEMANKKLQRRVNVYRHVTASLKLIS